VQTEYAKRLVLFPYGTARDPLFHERYTEVLVRCCNADIDRFIEHPMVSIDEYLRYIGRFSDVTTGGNPPVVVITSVNALALGVIKLRRKATMSFPMLSRSLWMLCVDPEVDMFFISDASRLGTLNTAIDHAPVWEENETGDHYLVLTPNAKDTAIVQQSIVRIAAIEDPPPSRRKSSIAMPQFIDPSSPRKP